MATIIADNRYINIPSETLPDLKAIPTTLKVNGVLTKNADLGLFYFDKNSVAVPDDVKVIKPNDVTMPAAGRWIKFEESGYNLTEDEYNAVHDSNSPSATNVFATMTDVPSPESFGDLTENISAVFTIVNGIGAVHGTGTTIELTESNATNNGYLSAVDWNVFNDKQDALTLPLSIVNGGTNSNAVLVNDQVMISNTDKIVESSYIPDGITATTQSAGDNSTKIATTAYSDNAIPTAFEEFSDVLSVTVDGQIDFTLTQSPVENGTFKLFLNGVLQQTYSRVGTSLTWLNTNYVLQTTDNLIAMYAINNGYVNTKFIEGGTAATMGTITLTGMGSYTVNTSTVKAASVILLTIQQPIGNSGTLKVASRIVGVSFTISSQGGDSSKIGWLLVNS